MYIVKTIFDVRAFKRLKKVKAIKESKVINKKHIM